MDLEFESRYHLLERDHWWFVGRRDIIRRMCERLPRDHRVLDVGCSSGLLLEDLARIGFTELTGIDVSEVGIERTRAKGFREAHVMDGQRPAFPAGSFDLVISSDSLEHMEHDDLALRNWERLLAPGGTLIVFVPAHPFLWSAHDELNHHFRRYTTRLLAGKVQRAGFEVVRSGYWNAGLFLPIALLRLFRRAVPRRGPPVDDLRPPRAPVNALLERFIRLENRLHASLPVPVGLSAYVVGTKSPPEGSG